MTAVLVTAPGPFPVKRVAIGAPTGHLPTDHLAQEVDKQVNPVLRQLSGLPASGAVLDLSLATGWTGGSGVGYVQGLNGLTMLQGTLTFGKGALARAATVAAPPGFVRNFVVLGVGNNPPLLIVSVGTKGEMTVTNLDGTALATIGTVATLDGIHWIAGA